MTIVLVVALCVLTTGFMWLMWLMVTPDSGKAAGEQRPHDGDSPDSGLVAVTLIANSTQSEVCIDDNSGGSITLDQAGA